MRSTPAAPFICFSPLNDLFIRWTHRTVPSVVYARFSVNYWLSTSFRSARARVCVWKAERLRLSSSPVCRKGDFDSFLACHRRRRRGRKSIRTFLVFAAVTQALFALLLNYKKKKNYGKWDQVHAESEMKRAKSMVCGSDFVFRVVFGHFVNAFRNRLIVIRPSFGCFPLEQTTKPYTISDNVERGFRLMRMSAFSGRFSFLALPRFLRLSKRPPFTEKEKRFSSRRPTTCLPINKWRFTSATEAEEKMDRRDCRDKWAATQSDGEEARL